jgi:hypothetical protein
VYQCIRINDVNRIRWVIYTLSVNKTDVVYFLFRPVEMRGLYAVEVKSTTFDKCLCTCRAVRRCVHCGRQF